MLMKKLALCVCILIYPSQVARAGTVTFDDGTPGAAIDNFYSLLGVVFSNASWCAAFTGSDIGGSTGLLLEDITDNGFNPPYSPTSTTPIVATFSSPQDFVSILGVDVGDAGMELDAYDAVSGGNLIGTAQFYGTGSGYDISQTLSVSSPGILRIDLYQPSPTYGDGLAFDNLTFSGDPGDSGIEPAAWVLMASGLVVLIGLNVLLRRRETA
jgi:hypothetical protein